MKSDYLRIFTNIQNIAIVLILGLATAPSMLLAQAPSGGGGDPTTPGGGGTPTDPGGGGEPAPPGGGDAPIDSISGTGVKLQNPLSADSITELFQAIIDIIMIFAIPIIVFFIIYAGFLYVTARGNTETIQKAHRALLYALIGALLILGANVLLEVIKGTVDSITGP